MASAAVDKSKAFVQEQLALLRVKLNQIPALQDVEVSDYFSSPDIRRQISVAL